MAAPRRCGLILLEVFATGMPVELRLTGFLSNLTRHANFAHDKPLFSDVTVVYQGSQTF